MTSSSLLPSKYFDKLQVNRLKANYIKSDNIYPERPSYLFSAVFNNATFDRNQSSGTLTITKNDTESIIQFSDRPFRQTQNIDFDIFISLFEVTGNNSFEEDPPNGVLTHSEEQRTYIIRLLNSENDKATFSLELLPGETHNLNSVQGRMNLFVDNVVSNKLKKQVQKLFKILGSINLNKDFTDSIYYRRIKAFAQIAESGEFENVQFLYNTINQIITNNHIITESTLKAFQIWLGNTNQILQENY